MSQIHQRLIRISRYLPNIRRMSIKTVTGAQALVENACLTKDKKMHVAWHPDIEFPYEYTKALPEATVIDSGSLIKEEALNTAMAAFVNKHPEVSRQELMKLTHTTKHRWFPRARDKKAKNTPMDREYL